MNGDSLSKASSRHSMVCEAKIKKYFKNNKKKEKKTGNLKEFVGKNTNNLLEMQCCKRIGAKTNKKKTVFLGSRPIIKKEKT